MNLHLPTQMKKIVCKNSLVFFSLFVLLLQGNVLFAQVPTITGFIPAKATVGTSVTISGTNFAIPYTNNVVYFGGVRAEIYGGTSNNLFVYVPAGATSVAPITVVNTTTGRQASSLKNAQPALFTVRYITPTSITATSFANTDITITGASGGTPADGVSIGDFNNDGWTDIVAGVNDNTGADNLVILLNNTTGGFTKTQIGETLTLDVKKTHVADFNNDGNLDIAVLALSGSHQFQVFLNNNGLGDFSTPPVVTNMGFNANAIAVADFNDDGILDIVLNSSNSNGVIRLGDGNGGFAGGGNITNSSNFVLPSNIDNSGGIDVIATQGNNIARFLGNNNGTFGTATNTNVGVPTGDATVGYFIGGDNFLDVVTSDVVSGSSLFLLQNNSGTLAAPSSITATAPQGHTTVDLNGDGFHDVLSVRYGSGSNPQVFLNNGTSIDAPIVLTSASSSGTGTATFAAADFNRDGFMDFVSSSTGRKISINYYIPPTYYSRQSGDWNDPNTWSNTACGGAVGTGVPTAGNNVVICNTHTVTLSGPSFCKDLTVNSGGTLNFDDNNITVNGNALNNGTMTAGYTVSRTAIFSGTLVNNGSFTNTTSNSGIFRFRGNVTNGTSGTFNLGSASGTIFETNPVTITNNAISGMIFCSMPTNGLVSINTDVTIANGGSGSVTLYGNTGTNIASGSTLTNDNLGTGGLNVSRLTGAGNFINNGRFTQGLRFAPSNGGSFTNNVGSTYTYISGGAKEVIAATYHNLAIFGGGTCTLQGDIVLTGNFNNNIGAGFDANSRTVTFNGTTPQTILGATTFDNLIINNTATLTADQTVTLQASSPITVSDQLTLTRGRLVLGANDLTYSGTTAIIPRTTGWIETNSSGTFIRDVAGSGFTFPIGDASAIRLVTLGTTTAGANSVRFITPISPAITGTLPATGMWDIVIPTTSLITFTDVGGTADATSKIQKVISSAWVEQNTGGTFPNFTSTVAQTSGNFTVFTSPPTITSDQAGPWTANSTWVGGVVPSLGDNVVVLHDVTIPISTNVNVGTVTIQSGATLSLTNSTTVFAANVLNIDDGSSFDLKTASSVTIGSVNSNGVGINRFILGNGGNILNPACNTTGFSAATNTELVLAGNYTYGMSLNNTTFGTSTALPTIVVEADDNTRQRTLNFPHTVKNIVVNGGQLVTSNVGNILGDVTVNAGTNLAFNGNNFNVLGNFTINGDGVVQHLIPVINSTNISITGTTTVSATGSFNTNTSTASNHSFAGNITVTAGGVFSTTTSGTINFPNSISLSGEMTFQAPTVSIAATRTVTNNGTITINGNLNGLAATSTWTQGASRILNYSGANAPMATGILTATATGNTVNYNGAAQNVRATTYHHLELSGSGNKTPTGNLVTLGNLTVTNGTLLFGATTRTVTINGTLSGAGTIDMSSAAHALNLLSPTNAIGNLNTGSNNSIVTYGGSSDQDIMLFTYNRLGIAGGGIKTLTGNTSATSLNFTGSPAKIALSTFNLTLPSLASIINSDNTRYIITNGTGNLIADFSGGLAIAPVGISNTSYDPISFNTSALPPATYNFRVGTPNTNGLQDIPNPTNRVNAVWQISSSNSSNFNASEITFGWTNSTGLLTGAFLRSGVGFSSSNLGSYSTGSSITNNSIGITLGTTATQFGVFTPLSTTYITLGNATWNVNGNWSLDGSTDCNCNPAGVAGADITVNTGHTVTVANAADIAASNSIDVQGTGTLILSNGNTNAIGTLTTSATSTINIQAGTLNLATATTFNGTVRNQGGTIPTTPALTFADGATYEHARNGGVIPTATWGASSNCNIIGITTTAFTIGSGFLAQTFGNFTWNCAGQTVIQIFNVNLTVQGTSSILNTGTTYLMLATGGNFTWTSQHFIINPSAGNTAKILLANGNRIGTIALTGDFNNGITPAGTVVWGDGSITGPYSNNISFIGTGIQVVNIPNYSAGGANVGFTVNGTGNTVLFRRTNFTSGTLLNLSIVSGTFALDVASAQTLTVNGTFTGTGILSMQNANHNLNLSGVVSFTGTLITDTNSSTITYNGSNQNVFGSSNYRNLVVDGSPLSTKTLNGGITVNGNLTINNGTLATANNNINIQGNWINNAAFTAGTGTVTFSGNTGFQDLAGSNTNTFYALVINNTSPSNDYINVSTNTVIITNSLTLTNGRIRLNNNDLSFAGIPTNITRTNGWVETNGTGINGFLAYNAGSAATNVFFPVGDASNYQPISVANVGASGAIVRYGTPNIPITGIGTASWYVRTFGSVVSDLTFLNPQGVPTGSQVYRNNASSWGGLSTTFSSPDYIATAATTGATVDEFSVFAVPPTQPLGNRGLYFDGVDDYVDIGTGLNSQLYTGNFTIMGWMKRNRTNGENNLLSNRSTANTGISFGTQDATIKFTFGNVDGIEILNAVPNANEWYHLAATYDGTNMRVYLNGSLVGTKAVTSPISNLTPLKIGYSEYFNIRMRGQIDEVKIFTGVRNAGQIQADMGSTSTSTTDLLGYWDFESGTGNIAFDRQTNTTTNNGTLINDPLWALRVKNTNDSGTESLREVITQANGLAGKNYIDFSIPTSFAPFQIDLATNLDPITESIFIDGTSQEGFIPYSSTGMVRVNTTNATNFVNFTNTASNSELYGLWLTGFAPTNFTIGVIQSNANGTRIGGINKGNIIGSFTGGGNGILVNGGNTTFIQGNRIGTNPEGTAAAANTGTGIRLDGTSAGVLLGGQRGIGIGNQGEGNLISSNSGSGIFVLSNATDGGHTIQGNILGLDISQSLASMPNTQDGIRLICATCTSSSPSIQIGGNFSTRYGNIVSGNGGGFSGISIGRPNVQVEGNLVGINEANADVVSAISIGILVNYTGAINPTNIIIGSDDLDKRNIVSGNTFGINLSNGSGTQIVGNYIGTSTDGTTALPNTKGVYVSGGTNNIIGGTTASHGNIISGNTDIGIEITQTTTSVNKVWNNKIGINSSLNSLGNTGSGVLISLSNDNEIGGLHPNIIANNSNGVQVVGSTAINNKVSQNSIYNNTTTGITLTSNGNANKPAPIITSATPTLISGTCTCAVGETIELFRDNTTTPIASKQGQDYLGSFTITVANTWTMTPTTTPTLGDYLTATITDATGNTSPFSSAFPIVNITLGAITPTTYCAGETISVPFTTTGTFNAGNTFTAQLSDATGSFAIPTATQVGTSPISLVIPAGASTSTAYRVRVVSSNPVVNSASSAALTINARPTVNLSVSSTTGSEAAASVITVTATASSAVVGNQTVNLAVTGAGITGGDYTLNNTTITILNGQTTGSVIFTVVDDTDTEGTETAILTISSPSSCAALGTTTSQNIVITDNDLQEINVQGNGNTIASGTASTSTVDDTDFGSVLECGTNNNPNIFTIQNIGTAALSVTNITVTGTNAADFTLSGLPTFPATVAASGTQTFTVTFNPSMTGNRTALVTVSNNDADEGTYTFAINGNGLSDTTDPILSSTTPVDQTVSSNSGCNFDNSSSLVADILATDNCGTVAYDYTLSGATTNSALSTLSTTTFNAGITTVVWTASDGNGNFITGTFDVTVEDTTDPILSSTTPVDQTVSSNSGCNFDNSSSLVADILATDNCGTVTYDYTLSGATTNSALSTLSTTTFNAGITTVVWTASDGNGNFITGTFDVTVEDTTDPILTLLSSVTVSPNQGCAFQNSATLPNRIPDGTASDNCGVASYSYILSNATTGTVTTLVNQVFNEGVTTVTWKAIDINGNESAPSSFTVTVVDSQQPPVLTAMPNFTRNTDRTNCYYTNRTTTTSTRIPDGIASDNCGVGSYRYILSGATLGDLSSLEGIRFNKGVTSVSWTATDRNGNVSSPNQFTITVVDTQSPVIQAPQNVTRTTNLYGCTSTRDNINIGTPTVSDNCSFRVFNNAPTEFPVGETIVLWTAIDSAGNRATAEQIVTIQEQYYVVPSDSLILVQIYNEMGGENWIHPWNLNTPVSTWGGIAVSCGKVAAINLSNNNLTGVLPSSVLNLGRITERDFALNIGGNRLSFESSEDFVGLIPNFTYSPQAKIYSSRTETVGQSESITLTSQTEGNFNTYQWYKDQTPISGATGWNYTIASAVPSDAGVYVCEVKNTVATQLILERNPITLEVEGFVNPSDSLVLVQIFEETGGTTTWILPWDLTTPVATWEGVTLSGGKIRELDLSSRELRGVLPNVFDSDFFSELRYLSFFDNDLEGQIPSSIGSITTLTYLDLDKNQFEGSVPASFGNLVNLQSLWLSRNNLTRLPNEIGNMRSLRTLYLNDNKFTELPETIGNLSELLVLNVSDNELRGLPNSITNLRKLIQFYANRNYISSLPPTIQNLVALTVFEMNTNNLTALPNGFLQLSSLSRFRVSENELEFDDLLPYSNRTYSVFDYAPQAPINEEEDILATLNTSISFTVQTQGAGNNYQWFRNGTSVATTQTLTINRVSTGDVGVYVADITNPSLPNLTLKRRSITLNVECQAGLNFEINQPTQTVFCEGQPFGLKLEINNQFTDARQIRWRKDGVVLAFASERTYTVTQAGRYTAEVLTANGCTALSNLVEISVLPQPEVSINLENETVFRSNVTSQESVTYQWLKDGAAIEGAFESSYTPTETGEYSLLVLTESGCSSISETIIFTQRVTGIDEPKELRNLSIFPNPNTGNFFIDFGTNTPNGEPTFILIDAIGRKVILKTEKISSTRYKVITNKLTGGMYHLQIQTKDGLAFRKFVIEE